MNLRTRRDVLRTLGLGAAIAPWIPLLPSHAAPSGSPRRLLFVHFAHGVAADRWRPQGTPDAWTLGATLQPLVPYLDRLTQIDGLTNAAGREQIGDVHNIALGTLLTSTGLAADQGAGGHYLPGGPSIDQRIAQAIATTDDAPRRASLQLGVRTQGFAIAAADRELPLRADDDPSLAYTRIFGELALDPEARAAIIEGRTQARDLARRRLDALVPMLGEQDRAKLERHRAAIDVIEARESVVHPLPPTCELPAPPESIAHAATPDDDDIPTLVEATNELVTAAFACDLTRVATLQWGSSGNDGLRHTWQGIDADYHSVAHLANGEDPVAHEQLAQMGVWYVEQFAALLAMLDAIDEGDGTLLDHTTCVLTSGLSIVHDMTDLPLVVVGGGLGGNRWLRADGASITGLWHALAVHMGTPLGGFGDPEYDEGVLPGLV